jgi:hypothetical protein
MQKLTRLIGKRIGYLPIFLFLCILFHAHIVYVLVTTLFTIIIIEVS